MFVRVLNTLCVVITVNSYFVGNTAKWRISKRVFQENKTVLLTIFSLLTNNCSFLRFSDSHHRTIAAIEFRLI